MARPMQKPRENRSAEQRDESFHAYGVSPHSARTAILLLCSAEPDILCQSLRAITKFCAQDLANRMMVLDLNAIEYILPHIDHPELSVKRFALKALSQMCQLPRGPEQLLTDHENVRKVVRALSTGEDVYVQEFASLVLSDLTREPAGCEAVAAGGSFAVFFQRMRDSPDPDVEMNCLQILSNLLSDPISAKRVTPHIVWPPLLDLTRSKFPAIQLATLHALGLLLRRSKDDVAYSFRASTGLEDLFGILESYEFRDIHQPVLLLMRDYVSSEENAEHVLRLGGALRLLTYTQSAPPTVTPACFAALSRLSYTTSGRQALFESGADVEFCRQMATGGGSAELAADAALGITNMTGLIWAAVRMYESNAVETLWGILSDEGAVWFNVRLNCLRALVALCRAVPKAAYALAEPKPLDAVRNVNRKHKDSPIEAQRLAVQCYINLQCYQESKCAMTNAYFIQELTEVLQLPDIELKILTCWALSGLMSERVCRYMWSECGGESVVSSALRLDHLALRTAICQLIVCSVTDVGASAYVALDTLCYMVRETRARYTCPAWEAAIEAIFRHHEPARLAYTGRLEINHLTNEGFYVTKRLQSCFPVLASLLKEHCSPRSPVYLCCFATSTRQADDTNSITSGGGKGRSTMKLRTKSTATALNSSRSASPTPSVDDPHLRAYLVTLRQRLANAYVPTEHWNEVSSTVKLRAETVGEFVAEQMCGLTQEMNCSANSVDIHVNELKIALASNVIPLGMVRVGGMLERAILYKVLADRVGVPCALVRASNARAWCEVAVPHSDSEDPEPEQIGTLPSGLLRANYVVDLMESPGRLLRTGSLEAQHYTGTDDQAVKPYSVVNANPA